MKSLLAFSVIMAFWVPASVYGAGCSTLTSETCEVTDFTLATCDSSHVCGCMDGYVAIRSGCAKKLAKPMVMVPIGKTEEVIQGEDAVLTCTTSSDLASLVGVTYEWKKGSTVINGETGITYTFTADAADKVGAFSCKVKYAHPDGAALDSEESDAVEIVLIDDGTNGVTTAAQPVLTNLPTKAADGTTLFPTCTEIPMGATFTFAYPDDSAAADPLVFDSTARDKGQLKCKMDSPTYFQNAESQLVDLPAVATDIDAAVITATAVGTDYVYKTGATGPTITCSSSPAAIYMGTVTFAFEDTADSSPTTTVNSYTPTSTAGTAIKHLITCSATFDSNNAVTSTATVTVDFRDDYITTPVLTASGTALVAGSRLVLTCGDAQDDVMYSWTKDSGSGAVAILRQYDRILQMDNFGATDEGTYMCTATKNNYVASSEGVAVSISTTIETTVQKTHDGTTFGEEGDYTLKCFTTSATVGMAYTWKKGTTDLMTTTSTYEIKDASPTKHNGTYTCTASFNSVDSTTNNELLVEIVAAGKECTANSDCTGLGDGYKGTCSATAPKRCECATDYEMKGDVCSKSHATAVIGSAILVMAVAILSRIV